MLNSINYSPNTTSLTQRFRGTLRLQVGSALLGYTVNFPKIEKMDNDMHWLLRESLIK